LSNNKKDNSRYNFLKTVGLGALSTGAFGFKLKSIDEKSSVKSEPTVKINELAIKRNNNKG